MTIWTGLLSFAVVAGSLTIVPGLDTALVLRATVVHGTRHGFATALGIGSGTLLWGVVAAVGISALLTASVVAYTCLRIAGAVYLVWIGSALIKRALQRGLSQNPRVTDEPAARLSMWLSWRRGLLTNVLNPKIGAFYVAVLPQFIPPGTSAALMGVLLALIHDVEGMVWFTILILAASRIRQRLARRAVQRGIDGTTGAAVIGFGVTLGLAPR